MNTRPTHIIAQYFSSIPDFFLTEEICLESILLNEANLQFIPAKLSTVNFYLKCLWQLAQHDKIREKTLHFIPHAILHDREFGRALLSIIKQDRTKLRYIPKEILTVDFLLDCSEYPEVINYLASADYSEENLIKFIAANPNCFEYITQVNITLNMLHTIADQHPHKIIDCLEYIDLEETQVSAVEMQLLYTEFFKAKKINFSDIPESFKTLKLCILACQNIAGITAAFIHNQIPIQIKSNLDFWQAVPSLSREILIDCIHFLPENLCDTELYFDAVKKDDTVLNIIPASQMEKITKKLINYYENLNKPLIVVPFDSLGGTIYLKMLLGFLNSKDLEAILISPQCGFNHPLLKIPQFISGIILPGGQHISREAKDVRRDFEFALIDLASELRIPMLGICRGHQVIGLKFGAIIDSFSHHLHRNKTNTITVKKNSMFKYTAESKLFNALSNFFPAKKSTHLKYSVLCHHEQYLTSLPKARNKNDIRIVARGEDKSIEALEINGHIITFQFHLEPVLQDEQHPLYHSAQALLAVFLESVSNFYRKDCQSTLNF